MIFPELVLASHNKGKLREFAELLSPLGVRVRSAGELGLPEPEETGSTFTENAAIKARASLEASGLPALADDSGLVIPALDGAPGIYSARWTGPEKRYDVAFARIQKELAARDAPMNAPAYFACALCLALPGGAEHSFIGEVHGTLTFPPRGPEGFGYDPIFTPDGHAITFGEMETAAKHAISHRARATAQLVAFLDARA